MTPTASLVDHASAAAQELANGLADGSLTEVEVAWSDPSQLSYPDFQKRLSAHLKRLDIQDVRYRPETPA